jgi:hypothetical protein
MKLLQLLLLFALLLMQGQMNGSRLVQPDTHTSPYCCANCDGDAACACYASSDSSAPDHLPQLPTETDKLKPVLLYAWGDTASDYLTVTAMLGSRSSRSSCISAQGSPTWLANRESHTHYCTFLI